MSAAIVSTRLLNQCITRQRHRRPAQIVDWLGAVQAQEYEAAKWGLGLRMQDAAESDIEQAFARGQILRTHVMRPTWHFVTPADIRWLLELTAPRVQRIMASYNRRLELDPKTFTRATAVFERSLANSQFLTRLELGERLSRAGLPAAGQRLAHLAMHAELEGVICSGPRRGKQFTYALIAERAPKARRLSRDESLAELILRYFRSHGPATIRDFVWWSGLTTADTRRGLEMNQARRQQVGDRVYWSVGRTASVPARVKMAHLLPIYDEYLVSYRDREAVPHGASVMTTGARGHVTFWHALVIAGQIAGTWRTSRTAKNLSLAATLLRRLTERERRAVADAADRFERFVGVPVECSVS